MKAVSKPATTNGNEFVFARPKSPVKSYSLANNKNAALKKSSSYQNLKSNGVQNGEKSEKKPEENSAVKGVKKLHNSSYNISKVDKKDLLRKVVSNAVIEGSCDSSQHFDAEQLQRNANRISVNTDLLTRVEKEKKHFENKISDLTQLTENRKIEIEKLNIELRNYREKLQNATRLAYCAVNENKILRKYFENGELTDNLLAAIAENEKKFNASNLFDEKTLQNFIATNSESICTTTPVTNATGCGFTISSTSSDWNDSGKDKFNRESCQSETSFSIDEHFDSEFNRVKLKNLSAFASVANLQGKILQMEEDNYTTTEELQATMQELCDQQRQLEEAQEENRRLACERDILLESLCTQTAKLEHCRLQISQLKVLLMTSPDAKDPSSREAHFYEIYHSLEQEKQALLSQNNDLAQSSDGLAQECGFLNEKNAFLQESLDNLTCQYEALSTAYQSISEELISLKAEYRIHEGNETSKARLDPSSTNWVKHVKDIKHEAISQVRTDLEARIQVLSEEVESLRDQLDLCKVEHEREATEWKLYERDLLKTVRIADGIKTEFEEEMKCMATENHNLREKIKRLQDESKKLRTTIEQLEIIPSKDQDPVVTSPNHDDSGTKSEEVIIKTPIKSLTPSSPQPNKTQNKITDNEEESVNSFSTLSASSLSVSLQDKTTINTSQLNTSSSNSVNDATLDISASSSSIGTPTTGPPPMQTSNNTISINNSKQIPDTPNSTPSKNKNDVLSSTNKNNNSFIQAKTSVQQSPSAATNTNNNLNKTPMIHHYHHRVYYTSQTPINAGPTVRSLIQSIENQMKKKISNGNSIVTELTTPTRRQSPSQQNSNCNSSVKNSSLLNQQNGISRSPSANTTSTSQNKTNNIINNSMRRLSAMPASSSPSNSFQNDFTAPGGPPYGPMVSENVDSIDEKDIDLTRSNSNLHSIGENQRNSTILLGSKSRHNNKGIVTSSTISSSLNKPCRVVSGPTIPSSINTPLKKMSNITNSSSTSGVSSSSTNSLADGVVVSSILLTNQTTNQSSDIPTQNPISTSNTNRITSTSEQNMESDSLKSQSENQQTLLSATSNLFKTDPLQELVKKTNAGSRRNALLRWCQTKLKNYQSIEVNNFSSSWNNGLALCALLHTYLPDKICWSDLLSNNGLPIDKRRCFETAFSAAESVGIPTTLNLPDMLNTERPDWNSVMSYIISIYIHFEVENNSDSSPSSANTFSTSNQSNSSTYVS